MNNILRQKFIENYNMEMVAVELMNLIEEIDMTGEVLENFCDFYDWLPIKTENGFNIADLQTEQLIAEEDYQTFSELVNRIVGRAIDYFRDEQEWDENDNDAVSYGLGLYNIAKRYSNGTKWEENWLEDFKNELEKS